MFIATQRKSEKEQKRETGGNQQKEMSSGLRAIVLSFLDISKSEKEQKNTWLAWQLGDQQ